LLPPCKGWQCRAIRTTPLKSKGLAFGLSCSCTLKNASSRGRGYVVIPKGFSKEREGWKAGFLAFHAFHTLSFPWPALETRVAQSQSPQRPVFGTVLLVRTASMSDSEDLPLVKAKLSGWLIDTGSQHVFPPAIRRARLAWGRFWSRVLRVAMRRRWSLQKRRRLRWR
jgi:hypothetical protein